MKKLSRRTTIVTKQLTTIAMFVALVTVSTVVIAIPAPAGGFLNVGDTVVLIAAACLGPIGGMVAGGLGSCIADLILGYGMYAPFTLVIKGLEGLICGGLILLYDRTLGKRFKNYIAQVIAGVISMIIAALTMSSLYCIADGILYGWGAAIVNAPVNLLQGAIGIVAGSIIVYALNLPKLAKRFGVKIVMREWIKKPDASDLTTSEADGENVVNSEVSETNTDKFVENNVLDNNIKDVIAEKADDDEQNIKIATDDASNNVDTSVKSASSADFKESDGVDKIKEASKNNAYKTDVGHYRK